MTLDERIRIDLAARLDGNPIEAAAKLAPLAKDGQGFQFSTLGMPTYFTGNRDAKTVFVQLNPGMKADWADERWDFDTRDFRESNFAEDYIKSRENYGLNDRFRYDSFDVKQAAFLYGWRDSGIQFKEGIEWDPIKDKKSNKNDEEKAKDREDLAKLRQTSWLYAKERVLMDKLQLELIPYASRKFAINMENISLLDEYVEIMMQEIFRVPRTYVIFGGDVFEKIFKRYRNNNQGNTFWIEDLAKKESIVTTNFIKSDGDPWKAALNYKVIMIHYPGKEPQKAIIAHTFPNQALGNAFNIMYEYGKACHDAFKKTNS